MRYAKFISKDGREGTIIAEDGGIVDVHHNGEHVVATLYQDRVKKFDDQMWDKLGEGKSQSKDFENKDTLDDEIVVFAQNWLCPSATTWEEAEYTELIKHIECLQRHSQTLELMAEPTIWCVVFYENDENLLGLSSPLVYHFKCETRKTTSELWQMGITQALMDGVNISPQTIDYIIIPIEPINV